ncbi:MAG: hypothetical protein WBW32_03080 [Luteibacter sp.]
MNKKKIWKYLTLVVVTVLLFSLMPEVRIFGFFIDAIGLDTFLMLIEAQLAVLILGHCHQWIRMLLNSINLQIEKIDPFYFMPSLDTFKKYPPIAFHAVPFLIGMHFIFVLNASL